MAICPKCNQPVDDGVTTCPACGQQMPAKSSGTLDIGSYFGDDQSPSEESPAAAEPQPPADKPARGKKPKGRKGKPVAKPPAQAAKPAGAEARGTLGLPPLDEPGPVDRSSQPPSTPTISDQAAADADKTLQLPDAQAAPPADGTIREEEAATSQGANGASGTAGRLKRLWGGAAGSSANPMHTLKGDDALATDSVFAKIARRVLVTDTAIEILERADITSGSQPGKKERVEECISVACQGGDFETADYNLTGFLGQGGMGVVLKANQKGIGRDVAIKMIQPSTGLSTASAGSTQKSGSAARRSTNAQKKKFFYEAQITGKLDHPNIVPIYELGVSNDVLFYSMKLITGTEWKNVMQTNSRDENLDVFMKVADAMAFAHQRRIIHRDLKPENVMLGSFGEVLVTDWGCAVDLTRKERFTGAGSPPWMAPEMAEHDLDKIGPCSDIYLMGAMLYQIIAGYPPHPGQTVFECIEAAQKNIIIPLNIEDPLLEIAYRAMETDPADRFQTVEAMQEAIREYRQHAESITLSERAEATLAKAIETKDYERFSRTLFGFQDAVELWSGNTAAAAGFERARLAYGQCAFDKGDFDLCLQTLDRSVPVENELCVKAEKAKRVAEEREGRFKTLRRVLAAVILGALGVSSALAGFAWLQWSEAERQTTIALEQEELAKNEAMNARIAEASAKEEEMKARDAEMKANMEAERATNAEALAKAEEMKARDAEMKAVMEADRATKAEATAIAEAANARLAEMAALAAQNEAEQRAAQIELGNYQSKLALSLGQVKQLDVANADSTLQELADTESYAALTAQKKLPKFENWALNRVRMLSNAKLLGEQPLGERVTAVGYAEEANVGAVATQSADGQAGALSIVRLVDKRLQVVQTRATAAPIDSISVSPTGDEVVYSLASDTANATVYTWKLTDDAEPAAVAANGKREIQGLVMSSDKVIGGINGGLWVWSKNNANWQDGAPQQISNVRGRLRSIQLIDANTALVLAELDGQLFVHRVNLNQRSGQRLVLVPDPNSEFDGEQLSAIAYSRGKLIVGTASGRLYSANLSADATQVGPEFFPILPHKHVSAVQSIRVHRDGTLLTTAIEPVVQVWKPEAAQLAGWRYESYLAGTPDNVGGAAFMTNSRLVLGVGEQGRAIVWDVQRQKQRQQLQRQTADGTPLKYTSPVIDIVTAADNRRAISIHRDGTVDQWELETGKSLGETAVPSPEFAFIGHSPGATFVDMAIDEQAGIMVTSALLPEREQAAGDGPRTRKSWEYCKWDLSNAKMIDRWQKLDWSNTEQEISLAQDGQLILYASNDSTILEEARRDGQPRLVREKLSTYFGVEHPRQSHLMMAVKLNGATRILDTQRADGGWDLTGNRLDYLEKENSNILSDDDVALVGQWSPAGDRFYLAWASGRITEFVWENDQLSLGRDLRAAQLQALGISLAKPVTDLPTANDDEQVVTSQRKADNVRLTSRWQIDLKVRTEDDTNLLYLAIRFPGPEGRTRLERVVFPLDGGQVTAETSEELVDPPLVLSDGGTPGFEFKPLSIVPVAVNEIMATRAAGESSFFATSSGTVYRVSATGELTTFGRPETLSGSGNSAADRIVTLHDGGVLWRADLTDTGWDWTQLSAVPSSANHVAMSPDGSQMLVNLTEADGATAVLLVDAVNGNSLERIDGARCGSWGPAGELALVMTDGSVLVRGADGEQTVGQLAAGTHADSVHFFAEAWHDGTTTPWLLVHTLADPAQENSEARIHYFGLSKAAEPLLERSEALGDGVTLLACSPTEGLLVTGGEGNVAVHFASPSLGQLGNLLFNLEGHAGAKITCLQFSPDGKTLISADDQARQFGWLSEDALNGISAAPLETAPAAAIQ